MAVPKRKTSKSRRDQRRSHHALKSIFHIGFDNTTGEPHLSHQMNLKDGHYGGRQIIAQSNNNDAEQEATEQ
ncbi:MAG: 50S ribosomal protein L32 [Proteobacteria bacterium]|nr:50S ribosomal protein L32 [Pseudomonadota bacterium]